MDIATWEMIRDAADPKVFERFLSLFPDSVHATDARDKLEALNQGGAELEAPSLAAPAVASNIIPAGAPLHECDVLAADIEAHISEVPGVAGTNASLAGAIVPCAVAIGAHPDEPRFYHQLARAYRYANDAPNALKWYEKAAAMGFTASMDHLGLMLSEGTLAAPDTERAQAYLKRAIELNSLGAMTTQGYLLVHGVGVPRDPAAGRTLLERAAAGGSPYAMRWLGYIYDPVYPDYGATKDAERAFGWYRRAVEAGGHNAIHLLARMHGMGSGTVADPRKAAALLVEAVEKKQSEAIRELRVAPESYGYATLVELQRLLQQRGYYSGALDGEFGPGSLAAAEALLAANN